MVKRGRTFRHDDDNDDVEFPRAEVCVNNLWQVASARHLYRATAESGKATQLCVYILGTQYLYLRVLSMCLGMGVWYTYSSMRTCT